MKRQSLSYGSYINIVVYLRVLVNKKDQTLEIDGNRDKDDPVDVRPYKNGYDKE